MAADQPGSAAHRPHWLLGRFQPRRRCAACGRRVSRARHMLGLTVCSGPCYAIKYQRDVIAPTTPLTGLDRSRRAVALAAGWPWCDEHRRARWDGADPCNHLHPKPELAYDEDGAPELPLGGGRG